MHTMCHENVISEDNIIYIYLTKPQKSKTSGHFAPYLTQRIARPRAFVSVVRENMLCPFLTVVARTLRGAVRPTNRT